MPFDSGDAVVCTYVSGDRGLSPLFCRPLFCLLMRWNGSVIEGVVWVRL